MTVVLAEHNFWLPPPSNRTNHISPTPAGGYPPEWALGSSQPYNSILDERRALQPVRLRAALVTGVAVGQLMNAAEMFRHHLSVVTSKCRKLNPSCNRGMVEGAHCTFLLT